ncbi:MAG: helix-turn-helix domain-containing protein [Saprospiraceae bacterium]|nr:helix-turn-helix domain-containing protein [Saprospiraceae bacterium]
MVWILNTMVRDARKAFNMALLSFIILQNISLHSQEIFYSEDLQFERYTIQYGYPDDNAYYILQDSLGYLWISSNRGLIRYDGLNFKTYKPSPNTIQGAVLSSISEAGNGNLWIASIFHGLLYYNQKKDKLIHLNSEVHNLQQLKQEHILRIIKDRYGHLWVGTKNGLYQLQFSMSQVSPTLVMMKKFSLTENQEIFEYSKPTGEIISGLIMDHEQNIWIGSNRGLFRIIYQSSEHHSESNQSIAFHSTILPDSIVSLCLLSDSMLGIGVSEENTSKLLLFNTETNLSQSTPFKVVNDAIESIHLSRKNGLWIKTYNNRLFCIKEGLADDDWKNIREYEIAPDKPWNIKQPSIPIIEDRSGIIWIGSESYGLIKMDPFANRFKYYKYPNAPNRKAPMFRSLAQYNDSLLILGSDSDGLFLFNKRSDSYLQWNLPFVPNQARINSILKDKSGIIWIGLQESPNGSLLKFNPTSLDHKYFKYVKEPFYFNSESVMTLLESTDGTFWIGTSDKGLFNYSPEKNHFTNYQAMLDGKSKSIVWSILEDQNSSIWAGIVSAGLNKLSSKDTFQHFLGYTSPWHLIQDNEGIIWAASPFGFYRFDPENGQSRSFSIENGLGAEGVHWICPYRDGLWMVTFNGISYFEPTTELFRNWDWEDGLAFTNGIRAGCQLKDGTIVFTVGDAIQAFHPDSLLDIPIAPEVHIESINVLDSLIRPVASDANALHFKYFQSSPEFKYIGLENSRPQKITYEHQLLGVDLDWIENGQDRIARYAQLNPGPYTFKVRAANRDGIWSEPKTIHFTITPPWWGTVVAKLGYLISILLILKFIRDHELRIKLSEMEAKRLGEIDAVKTRLYTNITHEFRTPLTIILGLANQLQGKVIDGGKEGLQMIRRNGNRLLNLVNQMLDLQKLEAGNMPIHLLQDDIVPYLKYLVESFSSVATSKNIELQFQSDPESLVIDYDPDKMQHIISNLLSNALKFTNAGGFVEIILNQKSNTQFSISVRDNGVGISEDKLPHIFDRFYQADDSSRRRGEGTGIGLSLTRELVHLLGGQILVKSLPGTGSEFKVILPITHEAPMSALEFSEIETTEEIYQVVKGPERYLSKVSKNHPQILIIEDNNDVVHYIASILQEKYHLSTASDGRKGIDQAFASIPDLIISDVMMPQMDGFQVCNALKQDTRTSHIPIILLTAKADIQSKLEGLQFGADAYLTKPFVKEELLVRIRSLLSQKERLHNHYKQLFGIVTESEDSEQSVQVSAPENRFIKNIRKIIEEHIDDALFGVDQLCQETAMSNSQLYRKLKAQSGLSAHELIQSIRLNRAKTLLMETDHTISEIAYQCGFNDPEYFGRVFKKEFGSTPSEFRNS